MPAQLAITIVDEIPGAQRREAFKLTLWSEKISGYENTDPLIARQLRPA
jgi:hypothetical protein